MASPFSIFRKHQKIAYAILTIACMVVFVFAGPFTRSSNNPAAGGKGAEVATWKFGTIYSSDVDNVRRSRHAINAFFSEAVNELASKGKVPDQIRSYPVDENSVLQAIVLHKKAEQMGIAVNDKTVNDHIESVTQNALSSDEKAQIAAKIATGQNSRLTARQLVDALRFELELAVLTNLLHSDVLEIDTPQQRWDYFSELNRRATVEVLPVAVKDFVGKVKATPSDSELKSFFEKYKDAFSSPDSPEPGFKEPARAKFQYFLAKDDELVKAEKPKVTDDEIKQYYEKNKDEFRKTEDDAANSTDKSKPADTKKPDSKASPQTGKAGEKGENAGTDEKKPADSKAPDAKAPDAKTPDLKSPDAKSSDAKTPDVKSPDAKSPETKSSDAKPDAKPSAEKPAASGKSSFLEHRIRSPFREELLALADDAAPKPPPAPTATDPSKSDSGKATSPIANDASGKDTAVKEPAGGKSADATAPAKDDAAKKDAAKKDVAAASDKTPAGKAAPDAAGQKPAPEKTAPATAEQGKSAPTKNPANIDNIPDLGLKPGEAPKKIPIVEYRSLDDEKVRDQIREDIAKQKVRDRVDAIFKDLSIKVLSYARKRDVWKARQSGDAPTPPDFQQLAKDNGVRFEETGLLTQLEAQDTLEIGKASKYVFSGQRPVQISFASQAFYRDLGDYKPDTIDTYDPDASFLWWRVDYKDAYVPEFDKVKSHVLEVWKMVEARKLALAQAKEYADEANKQKAKLDEIFRLQPNVHVSTVGPFTWMSAPAVALDPTQPSPPRLTNVSGVDMAGEAFMRTVFRLDVGSTSVAMNQPETVAYVIQAISFAPSEEDFHRAFLSEMATAPQNGYRVLGATAFDSRRAELAKYGAIFKDYDFKPLVQSDTRATSPVAPVDEGDE
jgi:hypothetical protein